MHIDLNKYTPIFAVALGLGLLLSISACGDDTSVSTETGATETGDGDGDGDGNTETGGDDNSTGDGDGDGDTTGDGDGDGDPGDGTILVEGKVTDFFLMSGIEGASISVKDMPGFETVSGVDGDYAIPGMPASTELYFLIDGNEDGYWGGVRPALLPDTDIDDLELGQISNELIDLQLGLVMQQDMSVMADETKGIVIVRVLQPTAIDPGVESVAVTFEPPLPMNQYYGVDGNNNPVLGSDLIDSQLLPFWVAFNVDPDDAGGAYSVSVDHPSRECTVLYPTFPVLGRYVTLIDVDCPPAP